ncbi:UNVERIFIED_CONTAM: hypothetical protein HDU68_000107, partial [Siphonaria sp. JEL0065]
MAGQKLPVKAGTVLSVNSSSTLVFSWRYGLKPGVSMWNVDLYSGGDTSLLYTGTRLVTANAS